MIRFYAHHLGDYMRRWILVHPWGTVRLHHILRSDADREPHDHPFSFVSIILWGPAYMEEVYLAAKSGVMRGAPILVRVRRPLRWLPRFVRASTLHRLVLLQPCWTLVFTGRRVREWGFQTKRGWVAWREFTTAKPGFDTAAYQRVLDDAYGRKS